MSPFALRGIEADVVVALGQTVTNTVLEGLAGNAEGESWVQQGLRLHEHRENCLFCARTITDERRRALANHFDESFRQFQEQLQDLDRRLERERQTLSHALASAPEPDRLYPDLQKEYRAHVQNQGAAINEYFERVDSLRDALTQKRASPFKGLEVTELPGSGAVTLDPINEVLDRHNARSSSYQEAVDEAAHRVEQSRLASIADAHRDYLEEAERQEQLARNLQEEQRRIATERERINVTDLDPSPLAAELTRDVAVLLGRDELVFAKRGDGYSIQRNGKPATALSEGEQTAISLLYFLCSLREEKTRGINATVVIDDPVSSLDQEILVGVSSHLWSALVGNQSRHQVILLTHSFELFRMWSNQLDRLPVNVKK